MRFTRPLNVPSWADSAPHIHPENKGLHRSGTQGLKIPGGQPMMNVSNPKAQGVDDTSRYIPAALDPSDPSTWGLNVVVFTG